MTKHTPGPWANDWAVIEQSEPPLITAWDEDASESISIASLCTDYEMSNEELAANAALIAAAPDLLAASYAIYPILTRQPYSPGIESVIDLLEKAIAKAEGRE